ncbi:2-hydroxy-acid oxidase [Lysinibacillus sp. 2017]|uniref:FAD-binding oxidoreductase n=1 Tax=unclassified Lysinibacillus TaxID=2636778 RepID=UPI000D5271B0|nr:MULTISPECIES: FAD-linked oxidase C-terminal domain-containing protein [unclassified Lysinibacillus]AWE07492.1 2-hydroxy-acid oxidase [Lysinibacillus sp. 2017]TGN36655.1 FAD-binding protein [Lysinibacillus sp. S2017]
MNYIEQLQKMLSSEQVTTNDVLLEQHSKDESYHESHLPDVVIFPKSTEEVSQVVAFANEHQIPVVPFGLGTSLEGHVIPYNGGISLDLSLMNAVLEVRPDDFLVKVQPGLTRSQLNKELKKYGLFFSVDPGADATLGGMAATNASGTTSVRYGIMRDQVRDLEVVLANGDIIHTGGLAAKSSSGYHLNSLLVGSEGTLGVITELTLRVYGIPEKIVAGRATFNSVQLAVDSVVALKQAGIPMARIELVDQHSIEQVNSASGTTFAEAPTLFLEFHGNEAGLTADIEFATELLNDNSCLEIKFEKDERDRNKLWELRHNLAYTYIHAAPKKRLMTTDVVVPINSLPDAIENSRAKIESMNINAGIVGHVGDGNYHILLMVDMSNQDEIARAKELNEHVVEYALSHGGTCTGEHGVGVGKAKYQRLEHGLAYKWMKEIKKALDPNNILNPGKIFID